jgi:hypothetical protein
MCTCIFLLRQETFDMIMVNNTSFYDGVLHMIHEAQRDSSKSPDQVCVCVSYIRVGNLPCL